MKKIISLCVSLGLLALIYWKIDFARLGPVFSQCDPWWMVASLVMVVPLTLLTSWRFQQLAPRDARVGFGEANRLILSASVLNLVLPSKMGDIAKALFIPSLRRSLALSLVVFEKACDMLSLLVWCVFGLAWVWITGNEAMDVFTFEFWRDKLGYAGPDRVNSFVIPESLGIALLTLMLLALLVVGVSLLVSKGAAAKFFTSLARIAKTLGRKKIEEKVKRMAASWSEMQAYFLGSKRRLALVSGTSIVIWLMHLLQIWLFIVALRASCPFFANLALSPLAILAGLLPLTFAGVGTRDFALVLLYAAYFDAPTAAALGILCTARYILPAIGGIPFFQRYLAKVREPRAV